MGRVMGFAVALLIAGPAAAGPDTVTAAATTVERESAGPPRIPPDGDVSGIPAFRLLRELGSIERTVRDARRDGQLTRTQARALRREGRAIERIGDRYAEDGLSDSETRELATRVLVHDALVNAERLVERPDPRR